ncbi:GNAT family N-acetyltransferase [Streptomyces sp. NPDC049916]|uniref:GNAT family N-acetyltransferase n=1 Tax=Streptomyces sp. NPDC049916 TaxID=3155156 RepID=UPI00341A7866
MKESDIRAVLALHCAFLVGTFCSDYRVTPSGHLVLSDLITDPYYNFFCPDTGFTQARVAGIQRDFDEHGRGTSLYATPISPLPQGVLAGLSPYAHDSWMIRETRPRDELAERTGIEVESVDGDAREDFLSVFSSAYSSDDAVALYGPLDDAYVHALGRSLTTPDPGRQKFHLLARKDGTPAGCVVLTVAGEYAAAYALGTAADARRQGVGRALMSECSALAREKGAGQLFLQTETGSAAEWWYRTLGYREIFHATCYAAPGEAAGTHPTPDNT